MHPGDLSRLAAALASTDLSASARLVLLSIAAATGPDNVAHLSAGRLGERCGLSEGHVKRIIRELVKAGPLAVEHVPGRASRLAVVVPEAADTQRAGAPGGERGRTGGGAPARPVSRTIPSEYPTRRAAGSPGGRRPAANPTPAEPYVAPSGGRPLRDFTGGRGLRAMIEEAKRANTPGDTELAAERERQHQGGGGAGDPVRDLSAVA